MGPVRAPRLVNRGRRIFTSKSPVLSSAADLNPSRNISLGNEFRGSGVGLGDFSVRATMIYQPGCALLPLHKSHSGVSR